MQQIEGSSGLQPQLTNVVNINTCLDMHKTGYGSNMKLPEQLNILRKQIILRRANVSEAIWPQWPRSHFGV